MRAKWHPHQLAKEIALNSLLNGDDLRRLFLSTTLSRWFNAKRELSSISWSRKSCVAARQPWCHRRRRSLLSWVASYYDAPTGIELCRWKPGVYCTSSYVYLFARCTFSSR